MVYPKRKKLAAVGGCKTLLLSLFCRFLALTSLAASTGWPVSRFAHSNLDNINWYDQETRRLIEKQVEKDDPFCVVIPSLRVPRGVIQAELEQKGSALAWISKLVRSRVERGRIVLSCPNPSDVDDPSHRLPISGTSDGIMDTEFEYVDGNWGTNADSLKNSIGRWFGAE